MIPYHWGFCSSELRLSAASVTIWATNYVDFWLLQVMNERNKPPRLNISGSNNDSNESVRMFYMQIYSDWANHCCFPYVTLGGASSYCDHETHLLYSEHGVMLLIPSMCMFCLVFWSTGRILLLLLVTQGTSLMGEAVEEASQWVVWASLNRWNLPRHQVVRLHHPRERTNMWTEFVTSDRLKPSNCLNEPKISNRLQKQRCTNQRMYKYRLWILEMLMKFVFP